MPHQQSPLTDLAAPPLRVNPFVAAQFPRTLGIGFSSIRRGGALTDAKLSFLASPFSFCGRWSSRLCRLLACGLPTLPTGVGPVLPRSVHYPPDRVLVRSNTLSLSLASSLALAVPRPSLFGRHRASLRMPHIRPHPLLALVFLDSSRSFLPRSKQVFISAAVPRIRTDVSRQCEMTETAVSRHSILSQYRLLQS
ncbi:hypothetical protein V8E36_003089 [Tilletia maclaganii]